jgi:hypothetical protein
LRNVAIAAVEERLEKRRSCGIQEEEIIVVDTSGISIRF